MKRLFFLMLFLLVLGTASMNAQVTIGNNEKPDKYSLLDLDASKTKGGLHLPRLSIIERDSLIQERADSLNAKGLMIYNTTTDCLELWNGNKWRIFPNGTKVGQSLTWDGLEWVPSESRIYKDFTVKIDTKFSIENMVFTGTTEDFITTDLSTKVVNINPVIVGDEDFIAENLTLTYTANVKEKAIVWTLRIENANVDATKSATLMGIRIYYDSDNTVSTVNGVSDKEIHTIKVY